MKKFLLLVLLLTWVGHCIAQTETPTVQWDVTVEAKDDASALREALNNATDEELALVESLKITGTINARDFEVFTLKMPNLTYLDLGKAQIVWCEYYYYSKTVWSSSEPMYVYDNQMPDWAFYDNKKLVHCVLPESLQTIGEYAFYNCSALTSVEIPASVTTIDNYAFFGCTALKTVQISNGVQTIGFYAFYNCSALTFVEIPASVTKIDNYAFFDCTSLASVHLSEGLQTIDEYAFYNCSALTSVEIPASVAAIGNYAFSGCGLLTSIQVADGNPNYSSCDGMLCNKEQTTLIILPGGILEPTIPATVTTIEGLPGGKIITFLSNTPPAYTGSYNGIFRVPATALQTYRDAYTQITASSIISSGLPTEWDITVTAEENTSAVQKAINGGTNMDDLLTVISLKVTGTINSYDFMVMRNKMVNLKHLDLSKADVVYNAYEHYTGYHSEDDKIPAYAFYEKDNLQSCILPESIDTIGCYAFSRSSLSGELIIPNKVEYIDSYAFGDFNYVCPLERVVLSNSLKTIGRCAFVGCHRLKEVVFGNSLKRIEGSAFYGSGIETLKLPTSLEYIGGGAFYNCGSLKEIRIPSSVRTLEDEAFNTSSIKDVYTYTIDPLAMGQNTFASSTFSGATLHVPETAYWNYYWNTQWSQFLNITQFNEPYEYFYLDKDFTMEPETPRLEGETDETTGEEDAPDADFNAGSGFIVEGDEVQDLGEVHIKNDGNGNGGSVIGNGNHGHGNIHAKNVHIDIEVVANRWYFFCFPYQIDKTNIKYKGNYVLRYYDGEVRAENGSGGWTDVAADYLERGVGYIFQGDKTGTLTFKIADVQFDGEDRAAALANHSAATAQDAGWNFIGNPHTAYFDVQNLGYEYPITVWNGSSYNAINPADDELVLHPYQAFFVQKPNGKSEINFGAAHRQTKIQTENAANAEARAERRMAKRMANVHRQLVNLTIGSNDSTTDDRTRVVFNEESLMEYETERDAAKFMADGVAQLYTTDGKNVKYAINERPTENGRVTLAYVAPAAGSYTIGVTRADVGVVLKDKVTGASHDFAKGNYTFTSEAGTFEERFMLVKAAETTAVDGVFAAGNAVVDVHNGCITVRGAEQQTTTVAALNGTVVGTLHGNGSLKVQPGVYVISVGKHVQKFMVK